MMALVISLIVFVCTYLGALAGRRTSERLPQHHLSSESRDVVKVCMSLIATLTALVLGLVTASAKSHFDELDAAVQSASANILLLDRTLARYGPETKTIRDDMAYTVRRHFDYSRKARVSPAAPLPDNDTKSADDIEDAVLALTPKDDRQRWLQSQALSSVSDVLKTRWLALAGADKVVPVPFMTVIVFWLTALFWSFGLAAPRNRTVTAVMVLAAASVAASVFLILEMESPFSGVLHISIHPIEYLLANLGK